MQHVVSRQLEVLTCMSGEMADSISRVETLLKELADYEKESEPEVARGESEPEVARGQF